MSMSELLRMPLLVQRGDAHSLLAITDLNLGTTYRDFDRGKQAYSSNNYDSAIALFSQVIDNLQRNLSTALLHRAAAYEMTGNYDLTLLDSQRADIITYNNDSNNRSIYYHHPDTYFTKASAQYLNGDLRESLLTYQEGISIVSSSTYPTQHAQLVKQHERLAEAINKCNQWMSELLPAEILRAILLQLSGNDRMQLALTCRHWSQYILQDWDSMWRVVHMGQHFITFRKYKQLIRTIPAAHVKQVILGDDFYKSLEYHGGRQCLFEIIDTIVQQKWNRIESLELPVVDPFTFNKLMRLNNKSLRKLSLFTRIDGSSRMPLKDTMNCALTVCPDIKELEYSEYVSGRHQPQFLSVTSKLSQFPSFTLTKFTLTKAIDSDSLTQILQNSPKLTSLNIGHCQPDPIGVNLLALVADTLPSLKEFQYTRSTSNNVSTLCYNRTEVSVTEPAASTAINASSARGLNRLVLEYINLEEKGAIRGLRTLLRSSHHTLETFILKLEDTNSIGDNNPLEILSSLGVPRLKTLILDAEFAGYLNSNIISRLIHACPSLDRVEIAGAGFWHTRIFEALGRCTQLRKLLIHPECFTRGAKTEREGNNQPEEKVEDFEDFNRQEHAQMGAVTLPRGPNVSKPDQDQATFSDAGWLEAVLGAGHGLHTFSYSQSATADKNFLCDLAKMVACTHIRVLELLPYGNITSRDMLSKILYHLKDGHVQQLDISVSCNLNDEKVLDAFASIKSLTHLVISATKFNAVDETTVDRLLAKYHTNRFIYVCICSRTQRYTGYKR